MCGILLTKNCCISYGSKGIKFKKNLFKYYYYYERTNMYKNREDWNKILVHKIKFSFKSISFCGCIWRVIFFYAIICGHYTNMYTYIHMYVLYCMCAHNVKY